MLRFDKPVPGKDTDARTPESRALSVSWNGPSLIDLVNDLTPRSVMLNPATVLSKLIGDFLVIWQCLQCTADSVVGALLIFRIRFAVDVSI